MESDDDIMALLEAPIRTKSKSKKSLSNKRTIRKNADDHDENKKVSFASEESSRGDTDSKDDTAVVLTEKSRRIRASNMNIDSLMGNLSESTFNDQTMKQIGEEKYQKLNTDQSMQFHVATKSKNKGVVSSDFKDNLRNNTVHKPAPNVRIPSHQTTKDENCASEIRLVNKKLDESVNEILKKCDETLTTLEFKSGAQMDSFASMLDLSIKPFANLTTACEEIKQLLIATVERQNQNSIQCADQWQSSMKNLSLLIDEAKCNFRQQKDYGESLKKQTQELELKSKNLDAMKDALKADEKRLESLRNEHKNNVKDFELQRKHDEDRFRDLQELIKRETSMIEKQKETALKDIETSRIKTEEVNKRLSFCSSEEAKLKTLREEINQLGTIILDRSAKTEEMLRQTENMKNEVIGERERIAEMMIQLEIKQSAKMSAACEQSNFMNVVRDRVAVLQENRKALSIPIKYSDNLERKDLKSLNYSSHRFPTSLYLSSIREQVKQLSDPLIMT